MGDASHYWTRDKLRRFREAAEEDARVQKAFSESPGGEVALKCWCSSCQAKFWNFKHHEYPKRISEDG